MWKYKRKVLSGEIMLRKGNIVRFKCGFWGEPDSYETDRLGVIEYSYGERYGNSDVYGGYCVLDKETGSGSSWWDEDYLEFVSEGGEDEIKKCKEIAQTIKERNEDLDYIKEEMLNGNLMLSGSSILKLFHEIGYTSSFERNGEYFCLFSDWGSLCLVFVAIFNKDYDSMIKALNVFKEEHRDKYVANAIEFYNRVNNIKEGF